MSGFASSPPAYHQPMTLAALKRREKSTQECVFRAEQPRLMAIALAVLGNRSDAEHLVADVFTDFFFDYVQTLRTSHTIPAYLRIMTIRRAHRLKERRAHEDDVTGMEIPLFERIEISEQVDARLWLRWLEFCIANLTSKARGLLKLHYSHELPLSEIAAQGGVSKQAIGKSIQKCLGLLRKCLETKRRESATHA